MAIFLLLVSFFTYLHLLWRENVAFTTRFFFTKKQPPTATAL